MPALPAPRATELGDDLPIAWRHRDDRYTEKLATPDTSVGDLVGDVDPVKVAEGRTLGDPETVHYGLVPRSNRGVFGLNELPDLAERIQVALFNVLEERDIQVRGYSLRLPLDLLLVATANPEDYTNRGRIITPLKDRFGAEIRTHYLDEVADEVALIAQEASSSPTVPEHLLEVVARFTRGCGVVGRRPALRRVGAVRDRGRRGRRRRRCVARRAPARRTPSRGSATSPTSLPTLLGKVEFEMGEEGREREVLAHLLRLAIAETFRTGSPGSTCPASPTSSPRARSSRPASSSRRRRCSRRSAPCRAWPRCSTGSGGGDDASPGEVAAAVEFVLEGLHLTAPHRQGHAAGRPSTGA